MPSLADLLENYRNWKGRQEWQDKKGWEEFYGGDSEMQERAERMIGGFGTGSHGVGGLAGVLKAYHGSNNPNISQLNPKKSFGRLGVSWVSPEQSFAERYAPKEGGSLYEMFINNEKQFDFSNPKHVQELKKSAEGIEYYDPIRGFRDLSTRVPETNNWQNAEDSLLFNLIKKLGYDTVSVVEDGVKNIGVFNPKKTISEFKKVR